MIDTLTITHNEALNLPHCLASLQGWTRRNFVVDSGSTDGTPDLARAAGAEVVHHPWEGYARQKNWALEHLPFESDWVLILDADEVITPRLRDELLAAVANPARPENGFFINRLSYFMDQPIRHCGYFPSWNMRLIRRGRGRYEDREVHEHVIIDHPVGSIREPMLHHDRRGLEHYFAKHNRYSTLEARQLFREIIEGIDSTSGGAANVTAETRRRRWLKRHVTQFVPFPGVWRFLYMYVWKLGFLDGRAGFEFCRFIAGYDAMVALKLRGMLAHARRHGAEAAIRDEQDARGLAVAEGGEREASITVGAATAANASGTTSSESNGDANTHAPGGPPGTPTSSATRDFASAFDINGGHGGGAADRADAPRDYLVTQHQPEMSSWSFRAKAARAVWMLVGQPLFRASFHNWYAYRRMILRLFGARVGQRVRLRPSVHIEIPWNLRIDDDATVGDHAILYSLGTIHIGRRSIVSQYAHLCAGTHDYTDRTFPLLRTPITIGDDCWIGADAFVGPNVTVGALTVVGARSSAYRDLPPRTVCVGNPAKPVKERELR